MLRHFILSIAILCTFIGSTFGQTLLAPINKIVSSAKPFQFTISGSVLQTTVVETTTNFQNWIVIQTNSPGAAIVTVTDWYSHDYATRFYRVRTLSTNIVTPTNVPPGNLADLSQLNNSVFMAGEGFNTLQFAANGKLGFIAWRGQDLIYRERNGSSWTEQTLGRFGSTFAPGTREEYRFQPQAALLFDSQSRAHILRLNGASVAHHVQQSNGSFADDAAISLSGIGSSFSLFTAAIGSNDKLHIAVVGSGTSPALNYGSNKSGSWQWRAVTTINGNPRGFLAQSYAPRWFSMAIDSQNNAHIAFCPQFAMPAYDGHARPYSELHYASDKGGTWTTRKISSTDDDSGDVGAGASIAIAPDDQPAIASWFNDRASTGSSQYNQLHYHKRDANGSWVKQFVTGNSAGYQAGDGPKGAGFSPYLRFDSRGRPNIAFCDDAAEHFSGTGQNEYGGNLRHAYLSGGQWIFQTIFQQANARDGQIIYPAMATAGNEIVFMGINRQTAWIDSRNANSTYKWFYTQSALP